VIWIGVLGGSIYRTEDAGRTWVLSPLNLPPEDNWVRSLVFSPDFASDRTVFAGTDNGLFRSRDAGATWTPIGVGRPLSAVAVSPAFAEDQTLLAATADGDLSISRDGGQSWGSVDH